MLIKKKENGRDKKNTKGTVAKILRTLSAIRVDFVIFIVIHFHDTR